MTINKDDLDRAMMRLRVAIDAAGGNEVAARMILRADAASQLQTALKGLLPYAEGVPADILHLCQSALAAASGQAMPPRPTPRPAAGVLDLGGAA